MSTITNTLDRGTGIRHPKKGLLWTAMLSMVMLFAGLTSAIVVAKGSAHWDYFEIPNVMYLSTVVV